LETAYGWDCSQGLGSLHKVLFPMQKCCECLSAIRLILYKTLIRPVIAYDCPTVPPGSLLMTLICRSRSASSTEYSTLLAKLILAYRPTINMNFNNSLCMIKSLDFPGRKQTISRIIRIQKYVQLHKEKPCMGNMSLKLFGGQANDRSND
jgi:hypothetical protein